MMQTTLDFDSSATPRVIASLRALVPKRAVTFAESLRIAKKQAQRLVHLLDAHDGVVPIEFLDHHTNIRIICAPLPISGIAHWTGTRWIITVNSRESWQRQRATIAHEFKHILDHGHCHTLYCSTPCHTAAEQAEIAATYFAGCALVPRAMLKRAWAGGIQRHQDLADHFDVSVSAIRVRLEQTGLSNHTHRCRRHPDRRTSP